MIQPSSSARALPLEDEMGTWGSSLKRSWRKGGMNVGGLAGCAELTAVVSGRKLGYGKCIIVTIMLNNLNDVSVRDSKALV